MNCSPIKTAASLAAAAVLAIALPGAAGAFDLDGKRVEVIVPFGEGGGTDTYARFMVPKIHAKLPGNSTLVIRNIRGAGSIAGANKFEQKAKPDGLKLLVSSTSTLFNYVLHDPRVKYDPTKWIPILVSPLGNVAYINTKTGITTPGATADKIRTLRETGLILGANGPTSSDLTPMLGYAMLGINIKPVFGLNRGKSRQALERGEFTLSFDNTGSIRKHASKLFERGIAVPFTARGYIGDDGQIIRDPGNPDLPTVVEAYKMINAKAPSGPHYEAYKTLVTVSVMTSKVIALPAGTPKEIVDTYRKAVADVVNAPGWEKEANRFLGGYPSILGEQAERALIRGTKVDPEVKRWLFTWLKENFDVDRKMKP